MFKLKIINKILAVTACLSLIAIFLVAFDFYQKFEQTKALASDELLKADKANIIDYKASASGDIVIYHYVSSQEVPPASFDGLAEDMAMRSGNSQAFLKSVTPISETQVKKEYVAKFYSSPAFQKSGDRWYQIEVATTTKQAFLRQTALTLLDRAKELFGKKVLADTFYSGAGDGYVNYSYDCTSAAECYDNTYGTPDYGNISADARSEFNGTTYNISRAFLPFDTSAIASSAVISAATLNIWVQTGSGSINIVQTTQANSSSLAAGDYMTCGVVSNPTVGATALSSFSASAYNAIALNSTGLSWIAKSGVVSTCGTVAGVTCLGIRQGTDIAHTDPVFTAVVSFFTSEALGTTSDPYLTVTYSLVSDILKIDGGTVKIDGGTIKVD